MFLIRVINNTNNISSDTVRAQVNQLPPSISVSKIKARIEISSPLTKHAGIKSKAANIIVGIAILNMIFIIKSYHARKNRF